MMEISLVTLISRESIIRKIQFLKNFQVEGVIYLLQKE